MQHAERQKGATTHEAGSEEKGKERGEKTMLPLGKKGRNGRSLWKKPLLPQDLMLMSRKCRFAICGAAPWEETKVAT